MLSQEVDEDYYNLNDIIACSSNVSCSFTKYTSKGLIFEVFPYYSLKLFALAVAQIFGQFWKTGMVDIWRWKRQTRWLKQADSSLRVAPPQSRPNIEKYD